MLKLLQRLIFGGFIDQGQTKAVCGVPRLFMGAENNSSLSVTCWVHSQNVPCEPPTSQCHDPGSPLHNT